MVGQGALAPPTFSNLTCYSGHGASVTCVHSCYASNQTLVVSGDSAGAVHVWQARTSELLSTLTLAGDVRGVCIVMCLHSSALTCFVNTATVRARHSG